MKKYSQYTPEEIVELITQYLLLEEDVDISQDTLAQNRIVETYDCSRGPYLSESLKIPFIATKSCGTPVHLHVWSCELNSWDD